MNEAVIDHRELYRLPWNLADNAISWLEPTSLCNLACDGCYRDNKKDSHKTLADVKKELDVFQRLRKSDCISIAGGDPLLYPEIVPIIKEIKSRGLKPIINTNGKALTKELLHEFKLAGVFGFTFHVDSKQGRSSPWKNKNEIELNELRLEYAQMLADEGGISCSFNSTVYEDTLKYLPDLIEWAHQHIDIVHTIVFIAYRQIVSNLPFDWYNGGTKIDWQKIMYHDTQVRDINILSTHCLAAAREKYPDFKPAAFLNGTDRSDSFKWMMTERLGTTKQIYGYAGPKFVELVTTGYHLINGTYLSYASPKMSGQGRLSMFTMWMFDKGIRKAFFNLLKNPFRIFKKVYLQSVMFIQPVDFDENGTQNMCDGCPDITVHNDKLVWSCRLEEPKNYGRFLQSIPREKEIK